MVTIIRAHTSITEAMAQGRLGGMPKLWRNSMGRRVRRGESNCCGLKWAKKNNPRSGIFPNSPEWHYWEVVGI